MSERISQAAIDAGVADTQKQMRNALAKAETQIADHWLWYLSLGIVLVLGGLVAIAFPHLSTIAAKIALGWIFLVSGVVMIAHAFSAGEWRGLFCSLLIGVLYVVAWRISRIPSARRGLDAYDSGGRPVPSGWSVGSDHGFSRQAPQRMGLGARERSGGNRGRSPDRLAAPLLGDLGDRCVRRHQDDLCRLELHCFGARRSPVRRINCDPSGVNWPRQHMIGRVTLSDVV